jgi:hypothetical protein
MPPTAALEAIKAYQDQVEKDNITPHNLPAYPHCRVDSSLFNIHAYRERRFVIIIKRLIRGTFRGVLNRNIFQIIWMSTCSVSIAENQIASGKSLCVWFSK